MGRRVTFRNAGQTRVPFFSVLSGPEENVQTERAEHALGSHMAGLGFVAQCSSLPRVECKFILPFHLASRRDPRPWYSFSLFFHNVLPIRPGCNGCERNQRYCLWQLDNTYYAPAPISCYINTKSFNPQNKYVSDVLSLPPLYEWLTKRVRAQCYAWNHTARWWPFQHELLVCLNPCDQC